MRIRPLFWTAPLFALVFFDVRLFGWDLLPDILGYAGLFVAFTRLIEYDKKFVRPQNFALLLFLFELVLLFRLVDNSNILGALKLIGSVGCLLLVTYTVSSLSSLAEGLGRPEMTKAADSALAFFVPTVLLEAFSPLMPDLSRMFLFISLLLFGMTLYRLYRLYLGLRTRIETPFEEVSIQE